MRNQLLWLCLSISASAQDVELTNKVATFNTLDGRIFDSVELVRANLDGVVWRKDGAGMGQVCYTNLSPERLLAWGIPTNRIEVARGRAQRKAVERSAAIRDVANLVPSRGPTWSPEMERRNQLSAQRDSDLAAINTLSAQIKTTRNFKRRNQAIADDWNQANGYRAGTFLSTSARDELTIQEYEAKLARMRSDYDAKYLETTKPQQPTASR
jgi:hypothetical protein